MGFGNQLVFLCPTLPIGLAEWGQISFFRPCKEHNPTSCWSPPIAQWLWLSTPGWRQTFFLGLLLGPTEGPTIYLGCQTQFRVRGTDIMITRGIWLSSILSRGSVTFVLPCNNGSWVPVSSVLWSLISAFTLISQ